jgi:hypothetical protein
MAVPDGLLLTGVREDIAASDAANGALAKVQLRHAA